MCIAFAVFLVVAFVADQFFFRDRRSQVPYEDAVPLREEDVSPAQRDPELYAPSAADDITSTRFNLTLEELKLARQGVDYEYTIHDGDTIDELARRYLGSHNLKIRLLEENPHLPRTGPLPAGTKIVIPFRYRLP